MFRYLNMFFPLSVLLAFVAQVDGEELVENQRVHLQNPMDELADKLVDGVFKKVYLTKKSRQSSLLMSSASLSPSLPRGRRLLSKEAYAAEIPTIILEGVNALADKVESSAGTMVESQEKHSSNSSKAEVALKGENIASTEVLLEDVQRKKVNVVGLVFSLIQNIVGSGVLSLPLGIAAIGGQPKLLLPSAVLVVVIGILSAYTFFSIGRQCGLEDKGTYMGAWAQSVGESSAWVVPAIASTDTIFGCMTYSIIIGDTFSVLAKGGALGRFLKSSQLAKDRRAWILGFTVAVLWPLCSLRKLGKLSYTSFLGTMAVAYTGVFMMIRYFDGSYRPGGRFQDSVPASALQRSSFPKAFQTFFSRSGGWVLIALLATSYNAHTNAPQYYDEAGYDLAKFGLIVTLGFGCTILISLVFLISGFLTFGSSCNGVILNSYSQFDKLASVARILFGLSLVCDYPVLFEGIKQCECSIISRFAKNIDFGQRHTISGFLVNQAITVIPLIGITLTSVLISDAGKVNAVSGALTGSSLIYILPTLMYLLGSLPAVRNIIEKVGNWALLGFGGLVSILGVWSSLK